MDLKDFDPKNFCPQNCGSTNFGVQKNQSLQKIGTKKSSQNLVWEIVIMAISTSIDLNWVELSWVEVELGNISFNYKSSDGPWSQKKLDKEPWTSHGM